MNRFFEYTCNFFNCAVNKIIKVHGVVYASSFKDAMEKLESYYGEEIDNIKLTGAEISDVYEFEEDPVEFILTVKEKKEETSGQRQRESL